MPSVDPRVLERALHSLAKRRRDGEDDFFRRLTELPPDAAKAYAELSGRRADALARGPGAGHADLEDALARALEAAGLPPNHLDIKPSCALCGDRGYADAVRCKCLNALCTEEQLKLLGEVLPVGTATFATFDDSVYSGVKTDAGFSPRQSAQSVKRQCREFADGFSAASPSLLLIGDAGTGKTFLLSCIAESVAHKGFWVHYAKAPLCLQREAEPDEPARLQNADLLLLDDLGAEWNVPSSQTALFMLIDRRLTEGRPTVAATVLRPGAIAERYPPQLASRLTGAFRTEILFGEDLRKP